MSSRILVVDDERNIRRVLQALLESEGHDVDAAADGDEARALIRRASSSYDLVLTDLRMPGFSGMELLRWVQESHPDTPVVMITAHGTVDIAVEAMRGGAFDFITKPFEEAELSSIVDKAVQQRQANRARAYDPGAASAESDPPTDAELSERASREEEILGSIIGVSEPVQQLFRLLRKVAPSPATLLIRGESGTGKELVASACHRLSPQASGPFVAVNCTAIPENLFESELFGHEKGAFTGAHTARMGRFELAAGGTLFLDEIGELPAAMQVKLLRVLQEWQIERIGGLRAIPVEARLIAATNADLEGMVAAGSFREDLFYRLNVVPICLPPLRERPSDIPELARHFVRKFSQVLDRPEKRISPVVEAALVAYAWPGNIRQLENVVERMILLSEEEELLQADLPPELDALGQEAARHSAAVAETAAAGGKLKDIVKVRTRQVEQEVIQDALTQEEWNVTRAAKRLGISRKGLQLKMKEYDLRQRNEAP